MSERYEPYEPYREPYRPDGGWAPDSREGPDDWREHTTPNMAAVPPLPAAGPTAAYPAVGGQAHPGYDPNYNPHYDPGYGSRYEPGQGYRPEPGYPDRGGSSAAAEYPGPGRPEDRYAGGGPVGTAPDYTGRPVALRRPDVVAGLLLVLAGVAAAVSLVLHWVHGSDVTGWQLMRAAGHQLRTSPSELVHSGLWQPVAAVAGGLVLFVLGVLLFVPARSHRTLGVLALLVTIGAGAGVVVALSGAGWHVGRFQIGFWVAAAVPVLGFIGSLKALMTGPRGAY